MRVGVTTTEDAFERPAEVLRRHGLDPVPLACIEIRPVETSALARIRDAATYADLVVVTSARAVRVTWPDGGLDGRAVAAVGPATAEAARAAGGRVEFVGNRGAGGLVDRLATCVAGATIVFPHARASDPEHVARLRAAGALVVSDPVYDTVPVPPGGDPVDAAVFGSPTAVEGWTLSRPLDGLTVAAMGPTTAAALARRGRPDAIVPDSPGYERVAALLAGRELERSEA